DWGGFFRTAAKDAPLPEGIAMVTASATAHDIVWLTGRPDWMRSLTRDWLAEHGLPSGDLLMRKRHDFRPARVKKVSVLERLKSLSESVSVVCSETHTAVTSSNKEAAMSTQSDTTAVHSVSRGECTHVPPCPDARGADRDAAHVVACHPEQGWSLLCNGVVLF